MQEMKELGRIGAIGCLCRGISFIVVVGVKEKSRIALGTGGGASTVGCCGREGTARTDAISDGAPTETRQRAERSAVEPQVTAPDHAAHEEEHEEDVDDANERGQYDDDQRQYATDQQAKVREARQREKDQRFALQAMQHCGAAEATTHARRQLEAFERGRAAQPTTVGLAFHLHSDIHTITGSCARERRDWSARADVRTSSRPSSYRRVSLLALSMASNITRGTTAGLRFHRRAWWRSRGGRDARVRRERGEMAVALVL